MWRVFGQINKLDVCAWERYHSGDWWNEYCRLSAERKTLKSPSKSVIAQLSLSGSLCRERLKHLYRTVLPPRSLCKTVFFLQLTYFGIYDSKSSFSWSPSVILRDYLALLHCIRGVTLIHSIRGTTPRCPKCGILCSGNFVFTDQQGKKTFYVWGELEACVVFLCLQLLRKPTHVQWDVWCRLVFSWTFSLFHGMM